MPALKKTRARKPQAAKAEEAPKGAKRQRTTAQLIQAAAEMITKQGYEATTLEAVAKSVGMSRGAIYGNFKNRDDLFLAVFRTYFKPLDPAFKPGASLKEQMRIVGEAVADVIYAPKARPSMMAELQLYAQTHEDLRVKLAHMTKEAVPIHTAKWLKFLPARELPMKPEQFIIVVDALIDGLLAQHAITPDLITRELIVAAFEALA